MLDAGNRQDVVSQEKEKRKMAERRVRVSRFKVTKRSNHGIALSHVVVRYYIIQTLVLVWP